MTASDSKPSSDNAGAVMSEPVPLQELEALEAIAGKAERLTVHNGTEGLMTDLVKLRY